MRTSLRIAALAAALSVTSACGGDRQPLESAGSSSGGGGLVGSLVNVDLSNVLNDLAVRLNLDRSVIPVNAQVPVQLAVNICGVSINILSASTGGQANCDAKTSNQELAQVVQQQIAAGGNVGGGAQGASGASTSGTTAGSTSGTGASGTTGTSSGSTTTSGTSGSTTTSGGTATGATTGGTTPSPTTPQ